MAVATLDSDGQLRLRPSKRPDSLIGRVLHGMNERLLVDADDRVGIEKLMEKLARYASGAAYVEARAEAEA